MDQHDGPTTFALRLRQARLAAGLTQRELADLAGLSYRTVSDLERGVNGFPRRDTARMLADALGMGSLARSAFLAAARRPPPGAGGGRAGGAAAPVVQQAPTPLGPLFGRRRDVAAVVAALRDPAARLVTVVGPGGVGKTRVALEAARLAETAFGDGLVVVRLDGLDDPTRVVPAMAAALACSTIGGAADQAAAIAAALAGHSVLLLLDGLEHLLDAAADLATLLRRCPGMALLATSREALRIEGELVHEVAPFAVQQPAGATLHALATVGPAASPETAAVDLFAFHAARARPGVSFDPATPAGRVNRLLAAEVCTLLDGLPLAIELAAAQLEALPLSALAGAIRAAGLPVLAIGGRDRPARLRTMEAAIDWSYRLLADDERALLRSLAVCAGSFDAPAAAALDGSGVPAALAADPSAAGAAPHALTARLARLARAHLIAPEAADGAGDAWPRYRLLEPVRLFALARLRDGGEEPTARRRHAEHAAALAQELDRRSLGPAPDRWLRRFDRDLDNLRAAHDWAVAHGNPGLAVAIAGHTAPYLLTRGMASEAARMCGALTGDGAESPEARRNLGYFRAAIAAIGGDAAGVRAAAAALRATDDPLDAAVALGLDSQAHQLDGVPPRAVAAADAALAAAPAAADPVWVLWLRARRAASLHAAGNAAAAWQGFADSVHERRTAGCAIYLPCSLVGLAGAALDRGHLPAAATACAEAYALVADHGDAWSAFFVLLAAAEVAATVGDGEAFPGETACLAFGAATEMRLRHGLAVEPRQAALVATWLDREPLAGLAAFQPAVSRGRLLDAATLRRLLDGMAERTAGRRLDAADRSRIPLVFASLE